MLDDDKYCEKQVLIDNALGLHARPAALFVELSSKFNSEIIVKKERTEVNGKSIMGIMMLAAGKGTELTINAHGDDAEEAVEALTNLIKGKFDEE